jgi:hypothetical protein
MPLASGLFNASQNPAELNQKSFASNILRLFPNGSAPMFALTSQTGKSKAKSATHGYFSKTMAFLVITMGTTAADTDTTITIPATSGIVKGMVFFNPRTRENIRVTQDAGNSATSIVVTRAFGRVAAAAVNNADKWVNVGTAYEEGSVRPTARRLTTTYVANYTQIFRNAWALTDTARASMAELGYSNIAEDRKDCSMFHSVDIESAIIWGQPKMDTSGTTPIHATQGVIDAMEQYAPGNTNTAASTTTFAQLVALVEPAFQYSTDMSNPKERVLFGDSTAIKVINDVGRLSGQVQINQAETSFGMHFTKFKFYKGSINLVEHPLLNGLQRTGLAIILDMPALKLAYLEGRDTKPEEYGTSGKIVENGVDAVGGSLTTECAVELINPFACAVIDGLTAGAA